MRDPSPSPASSRPGSTGRALAAAVLAWVACALLLLGPVLTAPTRRLLGTADSEAPGHLWRFASHLRALGDMGP